MPDLLEQLSDIVAVGDVARFRGRADSVAAADTWMNAPGISVVQLPFGIVEPQAASHVRAGPRARNGPVPAHTVLGPGVLRLADRDPAAAMAIHPKSEQVDALRRIAADAGLDQYQLAFGFVRLPRAMCRQCSLGAHRWRTCVATLSCSLGPRWTKTSFAPYGPPPLPGRPPTSNGEGAHMNIDDDQSAHDR